MAASREYIQQPVKIHVWDIINRELVSRCLPKAQECEQEQLTPGIVPIVDIEDGKHVRRLLPVNYDLPSSSSDGRTKNGEKQKCRKSKAQRMKKRMYFEATTRATENQTSFQFERSVVTYFFFLYIIL